MMRIFLLEDNLTFVQLLKKRLEEKGFSVYICNSINSYKFQECDIYIVDIMLEERSFGVIKDIRKNTRNLIAVLSHSVDEENVDLAIKVGADTFIDKLAEPNTMVQQIVGLYNLNKRICERN